MFKICVFQLLILIGLLSPGQSYDCYKCEEESCENALKEMDTCRTDKQCYTRFGRHGYITDKGCGYCSEKEVCIICEEHLCNYLVSKHRNTSRYSRKKRSQIPPAANSTTSSKYTTTKPPTTSPTTTTTTKPTSTSMTTKPTTSATTLDTDSTTVTTAVSTETTTAVNAVPTAPPPPPIISEITTTTTTTTKPTSTTAKPSPPTNTTSAAAAATTTTPTITTTSSSTTTTTTPPTTLITTTTTTTTTTKPPPTSTTSTTKPTSTTTVVTAENKAEVNAKRTAPEPAAVTRKKTSNSSRVSRSSKYSGHEGLDTDDDGEDPEYEYKPTKSAKRRKKKFRRPLRDKYDENKAPKSVRRRTKKYRRATGRTKRFRTLGDSVHQKSKGSGDQCYVCSEKSCQNADYAKMQKCRSTKGCFITFTRTNSVHDKGCGNCQETDQTCVTCSANLCNGDHSLISQNVNTSKANRLSARKAFSILSFSILLIELSFIFHSKLF